MDSTRKDVVASTLKNPSAVIYMISRAAEACKAADEAQKDVAALFAEVLRKRMPVGSVINRMERGRPEYLRQVKTTSGRDSGTNTFRIEDPIEVEVDPERPSLASWSTYATPISEKTGKDMNGAGSRFNTTGHVKLVGSVFIDLTDTSGPEYIALCDKKVRQFFDEAAAQDE
jgi:hypothetical protein